jgi:hypothetical protein
MKETLVKLTRWMNDWTRVTLNPVLIRHNR